jgi:hypothetical protein
MEPLAKPSIELSKVLSHEPTVALEALGPESLGANDDEPPPSSTRSKQAASTARDVPKVETNPPKAAAERISGTRADKPKRAERRTRDRGKGARSSAAPPAPARGSGEAAISSGPSSRPSGPPSADLAEKFFEEGVQSEHEMLATHSKAPLGAALIHDEEEATDLKILHKMQPEVRARRAKYVRYVTVVSAGCMLLGLAGLVRHKIARGDQEVAARDMAAYAAAHAPENSPIENAPASAVPAAQPLASGEPSAPATEAGAALATPPSASDAPAPLASAAGDKPEAKPDPSAATPPPADTETPHAKTAAQEKRDCQVFLDRGAFGKAIDAGERSVGLDPTDGEAWLLLGAAYQSLGRVGDARRSFNACLKQGKKGPLGECKAMLQ